MSGIDDTCVLRARGLCKRYGREGGLVRAVLVPACQRVLGRAAWYAPAPLRRLNTRIGLAVAGG